MRWPWVAALREQYDEAATLMLEIGQKGEIVDCQGYIEWPIFRDFRKTKQFRDAFKEVFGVPFEEEVKKRETQSQQRSERKKKSRRKESPPAKAE